MGMKIKVKDLRRIIREAVVDHMRLPRGTNSRDDGEGPLKGTLDDRINYEEDGFFPDGKVCE